jgi:hypothetical protein
VRVGTSKGSTRSQHGYSTSGALQKEEEEIGGSELDMVSTISCIQVHLQHSIAASGIISRIVSSKGIDMALVQEPWYHEDCIKGLNIPGYTCNLLEERIGPGHVSLWGA